MHKTKYTFGVYSLSLSKSILWRGDAEFKIDPQHFKILVFFLQHPHELITKKMLMKEVWGGHADKRTVANAVGLVKNLLKINDDGTEYIQTVPTKGYRWASSIPVASAEECAAGPDAWEADSPMRESRSSGASRLIVDPSAGWEGLIFAVGGNAEMHLGSELELVKPIGGLEMSIDRLPESERAGIFADLARRAAAGMVGREQNTYLNMISDEYPRFRDALDHHGKASASDELEMALNLTAYWDHRGCWLEGRDRLQHALSRQGEPASEIKAHGKAWLAYFSFYLDDHTSAKVAATEGASLSKEIGDDCALALSLNSLARVTEAEGNYPEARRILRKSLSVSKRSKAALIEGRTYLVMGMTAQAEGDSVTAKECFRKSLQKMEEIDERRVIGVLYSRLSVIAAAQRDIAQARSMLDKGNDPMYGIPGKQSIALAEFNRGLIEEVAGQYSAALDAFQKSFVLRHQIGEKRGTAKAMEAVARIGAKTGKEKESAMILGAADALRESAAAPMSPAENKKYKDLITELRKKFPKEFEEGARRVLQDVMPIV